MLTRPGKLVCRHDPDRFLTALFAPADKRDTLFTLYAFNHELARAREATSTPMMALIRLQWWREIVEGAQRRHDVAEPLAAAIGSGALDPLDLLALIEGREAEAGETIPTREAWLAYAAATAGGLAVTAGRFLGATEPERLRPLGTAYGVAGLLRGVVFVAAQVRCLLPADLLAAHNLTPDAVIADPRTPRLRPVVQTLAADGLTLLTSARQLRLPRSVLAAALPAVLARRDLRRLVANPAPAPSGNARGFADRLAVTIAGITGRI